MIIFIFHVSCYCALYCGKQFPFLTILELPVFSILQKRKYRSHNNHAERQKGKGSMNMPTRKSERLAKRMKLMTSVLLTQRKKIGVGEHFQAEVPDWTEPPSDELARYKNDPNISKMLGTRIWPPEGQVLQTDKKIAGQGRMESCNCSYPGSFFCRQHHTDAARDQLRCELGRAFTEWRFDSMGEEVSKMWTREEQLKFNALERLVPVMDHKTFWAVASKHLASKTRIELVRYYLNVFLMRRVLSQCRLNLLEIDSDEDETEEEEDEDQSESTSTSQRYCLHFLEWPTYIFVDGYNLNALMIELRIGHFYESRITNSLQTYAYSLVLLMMTSANSFILLQDPGCSECEEHFMKWLTATCPHSFLHVHLFCLCGDTRDLNRFVISPCGH